ncbi:heme lyase CcmF/NrfE family subunit [Marinobacter sp. C2H3]|uniref:heme lyase CcmF/NrfE family subunit n=1 Tax=Marinobacter sp. C2H3 TaxID=3119003 RepID=UPI00300F4E79
MYPELGQMSLILALLLAVLLALVPMAGAVTGRPALQAFARPLAAGVFVFIALAFVLLVHAFVTDDFSVSYVAQNSNRALPWYYKASAAWGGHEGSLLLWVLILAGWMLAVARFSRGLPLAMVARVLSILGLVAVGFLLFTLMTSNPFDRALPQVPTDGADLNPLLQDIGLILHPPMLYMGYVGFSVAFAFALSALISGRLDAAWARWSRPWTTVAWVFLSIGIALGSWWAYYELGWGGWWFWDPVENASLLPWLAGTALMHSLAATEKRGVFKSWTVLLAIVAFSLSLLGTFMVRSGVLTSVHAFASDPERGRFLLGLLALTVLGSLALYAARAPVVKATSGYTGLSREIFLLANNVLLVAATALVAVGTLYPLVLDYLGLGKVSVGEPFFNTTFTPLALATGLLMGAGMFSHWKRTDGGWLARQLLWPLAISLLSAAAVSVGAGGFRPWVFAGVVVAAWIVVAIVRDLWHRSASRRGRLHGLRRVGRSYWGMVLGHLGVAVTMLGVTIVTGFGEARDVRMAPGDAVALSGYSLRFGEVVTAAGPNYDADRATVTITRAGSDAVVAVLHPEKRRYRAGGQLLTEAAMDAGPFRDLFVALAEPLGNGAWAVRIQFKPLVRWVWLGAVLMALGGLLAVSDRRYRVAMPTAERAYEPPVSAPRVSNNQGAS